VNVIGESFVVTIVLWVVGAIALAIAAAYLTRPRTRSLYPGGPGRYLLALTVQMVGLLLPIPIVLLLLLSSPLRDVAAIAVAVVVGFGTLMLLRVLPFTGQLLKDLHRARVEAAVQRLERKA
jgi:hypothetical protein